MPKYNIFKIHNDRENELIQKLKSVGLSLDGQKDVDGFSLSLYLSKEPEDISIWWVDVYRDYINEINNPKNTSHFAVFIISKKTICYAIGMGKAHFYLKDYCESDFGINLAQRIADKKSFSLKNAKLFGGKKNKVIASYDENSELEYESGEAIQCVKAKTIDTKRWGKNANFGNSVQLHLNISPDELPHVICQIENELNSEAKFDLPRCTPIKDKEISARLDRKLAEAILAKKGFGIQLAEATVSGVDFVFLDKCQYRFIFHYEKSGYFSELNMQSLNEFIEKYNIDLFGNLAKIKISVASEHGKEYSKPLKYFLDYVDEDRNCLIDGVWHKFNEEYIEFLKKQADERIEWVDSSINFSRSGHSDWKKSLSAEQSKKLTYGEYYFNLLRESEGYINLDRDISFLQGYQIEKADLYKDETFYFVKFGTPQKISYVFDQSIATIKILTHQVDKIDISGHVINPKKMCIWIILDRRNPIKKISELNSLIFLMKLAEWQKQCSNAGYEPVIKVGYVID